jgi:sterol 14-demethylase
MTEQHQTEKVNKMTGCPFSSAEEADTASTSTTAAKEIPMVSGAIEALGHFQEFSENSALFQMRAYEENGEACQFDLAGMKTVMLVSAEAHEWIFRAPDEVLSAAAAYQMMVPIFGEGIQYGAPPEIERQQLKMQARGLRQDRMKTYAGIIAKEVEDWVAEWDDAGEMDMYRAFNDLTIKTSTHCLMGEEFRYQLTGEFAELYQELDHSVTVAAFLDEKAQTEVFARRDKARARLGELVSERVGLRRMAQEENPGLEYPDMLQVYMDAEYKDGGKLTDDQIAGMVIWFMFAGHHTSGNTSSWVAVELARHQEFAAEITAEIDELYTHTAELSRNALKEIPKLEAFINETLRLHPPLVCLTRRAMEDVEFNGYKISAGTNVMASPYVSHRVPEYFPNPEVFDINRPDPENHFALIPFGAGHRKCVGNAFAILQVKAIFCALLRHYEFELVESPDFYKDVMPNLILRPSDPCMLRYRRRDK